MPLPRIETSLTRRVTPYARIGTLEHQPPATVAHFPAMSQALRKAKELAGMDGITELIVKMIA